MVIQYIYTLLIFLDEVLEDVAKFFRDHRTSLVTRGFSLSLTIRNCFDVEIKNTLTIYRFILLLEMIASILNESKVTKKNL